MPAARTTKTCPDCRQSKPVSEFVDGSGKANPRGRYCRPCHEDRQQRERERVKAERASWVRKLQILYGAWWRHYCSPATFAEDIYAERSSCPYCSTPLPPQYRPRGDERDTTKGRAHLDHMDPLELGGEDSIRNVAYVCDVCNKAKGARPFLEWLATLGVGEQRLSREIYEAKHGHTPEAFVAGEPLTRTEGIDGWLLMDEDELLKLFPRPMVNGPPSNRPETVTVEVAIVSSTR